MADFNAIAEQFVGFYYKTFDENRDGLLAVYKDHSMLTFENNPVLGSANIIEKLKSLPFEKIEHRVDTKDAQPLNESGGIIVMVTGALLVDIEQRPMSYSQVFTLLPDGPGRYYVLNDIFRLVYPGS